MPDPMDPSATQTWIGAVDAATGAPWRSSLAEALLANGFEVSPPPIDDDADALQPAGTPDLALAADGPGADGGAMPAPVIEEGSGGQWWHAGDALPPAQISLAPAAFPDAPDAPDEPFEAVEPFEAAFPVTADTSAVPVTPVTPVEPVTPDTSAMPSTWSVSGAPATPPIPGSIVVPGPTAPFAVDASTMPIRPVTAPATPHGATSPSPPAFLAGRIARPTQAVPAALAAPAASAGPTVEAEPSAVPVLSVPEPSPEPLAGDEVAQHLDPRVALTWPEPQPLDDERWLSATQVPVIEAPVWPAEAVDAGDAEPRGFAFGDEEPSPSLQHQDPWAGVAFSADPDATAAGAPAVPITSGSIDDELEALRAQAAAVFAADDFTPGEAAPASSAAGMSTAAPADAATEDAVAIAPWDVPAPWEAPVDATPAADTPPLATDDAAPWVDASTVGSTPIPASWVPAASAVAAGGVASEDAAMTQDSQATGWEPAPVTLDMSAPPVVPTPEPATMAGPADVLVVSDAASVGLDPQRVEFIGYVDPTPATAGSPTGGATTAAPEPPRGSILDIGRRPPGARPVDPATLGARSAATRSTPGATGGDLWDLVTAPTPEPVAAAGTSGRSSRLITVLLTVLVALVIVALVVGFLYSFTSLL